MANSNIANVVSNLSPAQIYGDAGLIYIRCHAQVVTKSTVRTIFAALYPQFSNIMKQETYERESGNYYSLLMGREFKPGRWSILLDFDNKADEASQSGLDIVKKLNMDQRDAPKQKTPSGGLHYICDVDAQHKRII